MNASTSSCEGTAGSPAVVVEGRLLEVSAAPAEAATAGWVPAEVATAGWVPVDGTSSAIASVETDRKRMAGSVRLCWASSRRRRGRRRVGIGAHLCRAW